MCLPGTVEAVRERIEEEGAPTISRGTLLAGGAAAAAAAMFPGAALGGGRGSGGPSRRFKRMQDLTHLFRAGFPVFGGPEPTRETFFDFPTDGFYSQRWTFTEHSGTHMDAPGHFVPGGRLTPAIEAHELMRPLVVVDIRRRAAQDPNAMVTVDDLRKFERGKGRIPRDAIVAMNSGWDAKVNDPLAFKGAPAFPYNFPGFSGAATEWLIANRRVAGIAVDTLSLDPGNSTTFDAHFAILGADRYGLENVANLGKVPAPGATIVVGVVPWEAGSGGPLRAFALW